MPGQIDPRAGKPVDPAALIDVAGLLDAYFAVRPDPSDPRQRVAFGTSGHRGSAFTASFNEAHVQAISQAICEHRRGRGIDGPLFIGMDSHALSAPALRSALEVFVANEVTVMVDADDGFTPTPAVSLAILSYNRGRTAGLADGVVITPSHNPPQDGGFKYNPPHGGPAQVEVTGPIERRANALLEGGLSSVRRRPYERARASAYVRRYDFRDAFVTGLAEVVDLQAIRSAGVRIGIDPLGGASASYWPLVLERFGLQGALVSDAVDPTFGFMTADWDGEIRMDCSSPYAMARLVGLRDRFDVAFGNDPDADRHGVVTPSEGLMNPNHYLVAAIAYLTAHRSRWSPAAGIGKTMVTTGLIDRLAASLNRPLTETPVGFRWFVEGLRSSRLGFAGEESAGAAFLRRDGAVWTTEKDGLSLGLLAAEIIARTGSDPSRLYRRVADDLGDPHYERIDAPAGPAQTARLKAITAEDLELPDLAGEPVLEIETTTASGEPLGGVRVRTRSGWFAARPSGTEPIYKIYAESFVSGEHLRRIQQEALEAIGRVLTAADQASGVDTPG
ncbi:phosphoglucomutase [Phenylobacterium haematophilum]|jgi:phosphoglucomutase|uniref:Phosphoglucomutase n=1 Tax=Phenylobacterium haematophilum TaxID=98513 RepID=A0A840A1Z7_9CAUL|nr:alpha-D-glucose phosphate-specific phosphoglucomutase [Phenylobacterium haematophilum]MBB3892985.1 phosphoglucomutase [Phenylobacterium haematophilum]